MNEDNLEVADHISEDAPNITVTEIMTAIVFIIFGVIYIIYTLAH